MKKLAILFAATLSFLCFPFRLPNVEPIIAFAMPVSTRYGKRIGFLFPAVLILLHDSLTYGVGVWTVFTSIAYGLVGLFSWVFFQTNEESRFNYVLCSIISVILFDALTGLTIGPLFWHQSLYDAVLGQIPFTQLHLLGAMTFSFLLSPIAKEYLIPQKRMALSYMK